MISLLIAVVVKIIEIVLPEFIRWEWGHGKKKLCIDRMNKFRGLTIKEIAEGKGGK